MFIHSGAAISYPPHRLRTAEEESAERLRVRGKGKAPRGLNTPVDGPILILLCVLKWDWVGY